MLKNAGLFHCTESGQTMSEIKETKPAMIFLVPVLSNFLKVIPSPRVTYVCGAGARQGHRLNCCGKSKCALCLFIFRGVRITGERGRGGQSPEPQHRVVFRWTTYILTTGNTNETKKKKKGKMILHTFGQWSSLASVKKEMM